MIRNRQLHNNWFEIYVETLEQEIKVTWNSRCKRHKEVLDLFPNMGECWRIEAATQFVLAI